MDHFSQGTKRLLVIAAVGCIVFEGAACSERGAHNASLIRANLIWIHRTSDSSSVVTLIDDLSAVRSVYYQLDHFGQANGQVYSRDKEISDVLVFVSRDGSVELARFAFVADRSAIVSESRIEAFDGTGVLAELRNARRSAYDLDRVIWSVRDEYDLVWLDSAVNNGATPGGLPKGPSPTVGGDTR